MFKQVEIKMLPSVTAKYDDNNANVIGLHRKGFLTYCKGFDTEIETIYKPQHLYVVSKTRIVHGDYYLDEKNQCVVLAKHDLKKINNIETNHKIVASTDETLKLLTLTEIQIKCFILSYNNKNITPILVNFNDVDVVESSTSYDDDDIIVNGTKVCSIDHESTNEIRDIVEKYNYPYSINGFIEII